MELYVYSKNQLQIQQVCLLQLLHFYGNIVATTNYETSPSPIPDSWGSLIRLLYFLYLFLGAFVVHIENNARYDGKSKGGILYYPENLPSMYKYRLPSCYIWLSCTESITYIVSAKCNIIFIIGLRQTDSFGLTCHKIKDGASKRCIAQHKCINKNRPVQKWM